MVMFFHSCSVSLPEHLALAAPYVQVKESILLFDFCSDLTNQFECNLLTGKLND